MRFLLAHHQNGENAIEHYLDTDRPTARNNRVVGGRDPRMDENQIRKDVKPLDLLGNDAPMMGIQYKTFNRIEERGNCIQGPYSVHTSDHPRERGSGRRAVLLRMLLVSHGNGDRADNEEQLHAILTGRGHLAEKTA